MMNSDLKQLIRLQEVDAAIAEYQARTDAFPARSKALDDKLASALAGVEKAKDAMAKSQGKRKDHETRVTDLEAKISKYRDQLMTVKTNEEYKAMTREIEFSQAKITAEEDAILVIMEEAETLAANLKAAEDVLARDQKLVASDRKELGELNAGDVKTLTAYQDERAELVKSITEEVIEYYERVRKARGVGLAKATDEACVLCNVRMRPQRFHEVRRNDTIIACDSCGRILYYPENLDHPFEVA